jgi:hypothetical protein
MSRARACKCYFTRACEQLEPNKRLTERKFFIGDALMVTCIGTGKQYEGTKIQHSIFVDADPLSSQLMRLIWVLQRTLCIRIL